ncbi:MAG: TfoX/Sxy family protein [Pseudomonadota bacterium]
MSGFVDYLPEVFAEFGTIALRRMFGGHGVYHQGLMFGLVADDVLYLKADADSVHHFEQAGLPSFEYVTDDRTVRMSYYRAPDDIFDDRELAAQWARRAFDAALRAQARKPAAKKGAPARKGRK